LILYYSINVLFLKICFGYIEIFFFYGFISESGIWGGIGPSTASQITSAWYNVSATLGCGDASSNSSALLSCMRTKPYQNITNALPASSSFGTTSFGPSIDDVVVFSDLKARAVAGNFVKLPLLVGNADNEAGLFRAAAVIEGVAGSLTPSYLDAVNQFGFTCPASGRANISIAQDIPTWRYRWFGFFPNTIITTDPPSGAWVFTPPSNLLHCIEIANSKFSMHPSFPHSSTSTPPAPTSRPPLPKN